MAVSLFMGTNRSRFQSSRRWLVSWRDAPAALFSLARRLAPLVNRKDDRLSGEDGAVVLFWGLLFLVGGELGFGRLLRQQLCLFLLIRGVVFRLFLRGLLLIGFGGSIAHGISFGWIVSLVGELIRSERDALILETLYV